MLLPTEHAGAGTVVFGLLLVAAFHPDAREAGVHVHILVEGEGLFGGGEGVVELAAVEVDFGLGMPGGGVIGIGGEGLVDEAQGLLVLTEGELEDGVVDEVLRRKIGHAGKGRERKKGGKGKKKN